MNKTPAASSLDQINVERVGFLSTRIYGTDGVSLEIDKWTRVLCQLGYDCYFVAGQLDREPSKSYQIELADFRHPEIRKLTAECFGQSKRSPRTSERIRQLTQAIKEDLHRAVEQFQLDVLIAENALTLPMNLPLGIAIEEMLAESLLPCIAHHHDFVWERDRYLVNAVEDYLTAAFPAPRADIHHVVINSLAGREFSRRTGLPYRVVPNVMDFEHPPELQVNSFASDFRQAIGLAKDDILILQPTRVVARKGIEHSIELVRRLDDPRCKLVITHGEDDEGSAYPHRIREYAQLLGVDLIFAADRIGHMRGTRFEGEKTFSIWDAYQEADLVTYPSTYEGFGNAFLESVYYKKPIFCNRYTIFRTDIEPCGFRTITMDGFLTNDVLNEVRRVLQDAPYRQEMVDHNYQVARRYFSFDRVAHELGHLLSDPHLECQLHACRACKKAR